MRRFWQRLDDSSGSVLILVAGLIFFVAAFTVLAVDVSKLLVTRAQLQNAARSLVLQSSTCRDLANRLVGRQACLNVYRNYPGGPPRYELQRITGGPDVFTIEARGDYPGERVFMTSIVEFRDGKIARQTDYFASAFEAPSWRADWVQRVT